MNIILYLLQLIQYQHQQICWLLNFICRYIPLKQWAFDDSHSPKYQKFKIDSLPLITDFRQDWTYKELIPYYEKRYGKKIRPISRRSECDIPDSCTCPRCDAPDVLIAATPWFPKRTGNTSLSINASIPNVLTTFTTSKKLTRQISQRIMVKINISSITSTVSSRWIFSAWA